MKHKVFVVVLVLAVAVLAGCTTNAPEEPTTPEPQGSSVDTIPQEETPPSQEPSSEQETPDVTLRFTGENYVFIHEGEQNPTVTVQEGDLVRVEYETTSGLHDWVVDAFAATSQVQASDGVQVIEFVADQTGTFEYYCSVGSHRQQGMFGTFIVE